MTQQQCVALFRSKGGCSRSAHLQICKPSEVIASFLAGAMSSVYVQVVLEAGDMLVVPKGKTHYAEVIGRQSCEFVDASKW